MGGSEEQSFLKLLERWYGSDAEVRAIDLRITGKTTEPFSDTGRLMSTTVKSSQSES